MPRIATCACGNLRTICEGEPSKVSLCHCLACQRRTGSTYGVAAFFRQEDVRIDGPSKCFTRPSDGVFLVRHHFCPDCGSTVYWLPERMPGLIAIAVGSFADPAFPAPTQAVYTQHRHSWVNDVPRQA